MENNIDPRHLHNEIPSRLGNISDISTPKITPNPEKLLELAEHLIADMAAADGFINAFFSSENIRYREIVESGDTLQKDQSVWNQTDLPIIPDVRVPFTPIIALSGGPDSGLSARLCIEAYRNRDTAHKTDLDAIYLVTFRSQFHDETDCGRGEQFALHMQNTFGEEVPIRIIHAPYPGNDALTFVKAVTDGYTLMHGKIQNLTEALTNTLISLPGEETGFHCSFDTANMTEFLLDEVTNGSTGATNASLFNGIPKSVVLQMCKYFDIDGYLTSDNSTTWENKAESYLVGAQNADTERVFYAIDTIHYLAIRKEQTIDEIVEETGFAETFVANIFARMVNHAKRSHLGGQNFMGNHTPLECRGKDFFTDLYIRTCRDEIGAALGIGE